MREITGVTLNEADEMQKRMRANATHFVHCNSGKALFVKEADFFRAQGGDTQEWGKVWRPVIATSVGDARRQAAKIFDVPLSPIHRGEQ